MSVSGFSFVRFHPAYGIAEKTMAERNDCTMIIGVPKEIKAFENRVALLPSGVSAFTDAGHAVCVENNAGVGSGFSNEEYVSAGARMVETAKEVYARADMIYKVKEPLAPEYALLREGQILFTYLHLAPDTEQTQALLNAKVIGKIGRAHV